MFFTCLFLLFLNIQFALSSCSHGTYLNPRRVGKFALPDYGYGTIDGPVNWHNINPKEYKLCGIGRTQSPVDLPLVVPNFFPKMTVPPHKAPFENRGTTVEVEIHGTTTVQIPGQTKWKLLQFHFHTPSEHRINGEHFPIEMHMVHESENTPKALLVVALLFQLNLENSTKVIDEVISYIDMIPEPGDIVEIPDLNLEPLTSEINKMGFNLYLGSLTTPPCEEGVGFLTPSLQLPLNVTSYNSLKAVVGFNSRFLQTYETKNILCTSAEGLNCSGKPKDSALLFQQPLVEL